MRKKTLSVAYSTLIPFQMRTKTFLISLFFKLAKLSRKIMIDRYFNFNLTFILFKGPRFTRNWTCLSVNLKCILQKHVNKHSQLYHMEIYLWNDEATNHYNIALFIVSKFLRKFKQKRLSTYRIPKHKCIKNSTSQLSLYLRQTAHNRDEEIRYRNCDRNFCRRGCDIHWLKRGP